MKKSPPEEEGYRGYFLTEFYFDCFWTFTARTFYELNFCSFAELSCVALNIVRVYEEVLTASIWSDEAEAFLNVKKFYCAFFFCHV
jgi:hypothetical protein